jgi:hypothetical protein
MPDPIATSLTTLAVLVCLAAGSIPQSQGDPLTVTKKETKLRTQKRLFAPGVADLKEGDRVGLVLREGAWVKVAWTKPGGDTVSGWLHESDVSSRKDVRLSGQGIREKYTVSEAEAARKGFNPQVEKAYRDRNPNLEAAFALVDRIQATNVPEAEIERFLREGRLLQEGVR